MSKVLLAAAGLAATCCTAADVVLASFDGKPGTTFNWSDMNGEF